MEVDFVLVPAQESGQCFGCAHFPAGRRCNTVNGVKLRPGQGVCTEGLDGKPGSTIWVEAGKANPPPAPASEPQVTCKVTAHKAAYRAEARKNDPATSKGKKRVNKYELCVLTVLGIKKEGATGKEIAAFSGEALNSLTPRFAPLRRKGLIKALEVPIEWGENRMFPRYVKRDKQIVWVLA